MNKQIHSNDISVKVQSFTKTKRVREAPENFQALKQTVEAQVQGELTNNDEIISPSTNERNYHIKYLDGDNELINVSDDEDLLAAYDVAKKDLKGNLKFIIEFKQKFKVIKKREESDKKKDKEVKKSEKTKKSNSKDYHEEEKTESTVPRQTERHIKKSFARVIKEEVERIGKEIVQDNFTNVA